jgi:hypothetical protein
MLNAQSLGRANGDMVTLQKDGTLREANESTRGHRPRALPQYYGLTAQVRLFVSLKTTENNPHLVVSERRPVRFDERVAHSVHESPGWTC